jgi:hypothetical protein
MRYRANPTSRKSSNSVVNQIVKKYSKKTSRREQPMQRYIKRFYTSNMKQEVEEEVARTEPSGPVKETKAEMKSRWFKAFRRVTKDHWDNEDDDFKAAIGEEIHACTTSTAEGDEIEMVEERTPDEYAECVVPLCPRSLYLSFQFQGDSNLASSCERRLDAACSPLRLEVFGHNGRS